MAKSWTIVCLKVVFILFCILLFLAGGCILGWCLRTVFYLQDDDKELIFKVAGQIERLQKIRIVLYINSGIGAGLCLSSILGIIAALRESSLALIVYFVLVFLLMLGIIASVVYVLVALHSAERRMKYKIAVWFKENLVDYYDEKKIIRKLLDRIQKMMFCCGATGCNDYGERIGGPPVSCYCQSGPPGCSDKLFEAIASSKQLIETPMLIGAGAVTVLELIALLLSCVLRASIFKHVEQAQESGRELKTFSSSDRRLDSAANQSLTTSRQD